MFFSPLFELYFRYQKTVHDFLLYMTLYLIGYFVDGLLYYGFGYNLPTVSLLIFVCGFLIARFIIRRMGAQELFGGYAKYGVLYAMFLGIFMWFNYLILIRIPKFR